MCPGRLTEKEQLSYKEKFGVDYDPLYKQKKEERLREMLGDKYDPEYAARKRRGISSSEPNTETQQTYTQEGPSHGKPAIRIITHKDAARVDNAPFKKAPPRYEPDWDSELRVRPSAQRNNAQREYSNKRDSAEPGGFGDRQPDKQIKLEVRQSRMSASADINLASLSVCGKEYTSAVYLMCSNASTTPNNPFVAIVFADNRREIGVLIPHMDIPAENARGTEYYLADSRLYLFKLLSLDSGELIARGDVPDDEHIMSIVLIDDILIFTTQHMVFSVHLRHCAATPDTAEKSYTYCTEHSPVDCYHINNHTASVLKDANILESHVLTNLSAIALKDRVVCLISSTTPLNKCDLIDCAKSIVEAVPNAELSFGFHSFALCFELYNSPEFAKLEALKVVSDNKDNIGTEEHHRSEMSLISQPLFSLECPGLLQDCQLTHNVDLEQCSSFFSTMVERTRAFSDACGVSMEAELAYYSDINSLLHINTNTSTGPSKRQQTQNSIYAVLNIHLLFLEFSTASCSFEHRLAFFNHIVPLVGSSGAKETLWNTISSSCSHNDTLDAFVDQCCDQKSYPFINPFMQWSIVVSDRHDNKSLGSSSFGLELLPVNVELKAGLSSFVILLQQYLRPPSTESSSDRIGSPFMTNATLLLTDLQSCVFMRLAEAAPAFVATITGNPPPSSQYSPVPPYGSSFLPDYASLYMQDINIVASAVFPAADGGFGSSIVYQLTYNGIIIPDNFTAPTLMRSYDVFFPLIRFLMPDNSAQAELDNRMNRLKRDDIIALKKEAFLQFLTCDDTVMGNVTGCTVGTNMFVLLTEGGYCYKGEITRQHTFSSSNSVPGIPVLGSGTSSQFLLNIVSSKQDSAFRTSLSTLAPKITAVYRALEQTIISKSRYHSLVTNGNVAPFYSRHLCTCIPSRFLAKSEQSERFKFMRKSSQLPFFIFSSCGSSNSYTGTMENLIMVRLEDIDRLYSRVADYNRSNSGPSRPTFSFQPAPSFNSPPPALDISFPVHPTNSFAGGPMKTAAGAIGRSYPPSSQRYPSETYDEKIARLKRQFGDNFDISRVKPTD